MNNYFWVAGACASLCALLYIAAVNFDYFAPYKIGQFYRANITTWLFNAPFWLIASVGCISFALGCLSNIT